jgi:hypothetical protein
MFSKLKSKDKNLTIGNSFNNVTVAFWQSTWPFGNQLGLLAMLLPFGNAFAFWQNMNCGIELKCDYYIWNSFDK